MSANLSQPPGRRPALQVHGTSPTDPPTRPGHTSIFTDTGDDGGDRLLCPPIHTPRPAPGPQNAARLGSGVVAEATS